MLAARWIPIELASGLPRPDRTDASAHLVSSLSSADFPNDHFVIGPSGLFHLAASAKGAG